MFGQYAPVHPDGKVPVGLLDSEQTIFLFEDATVAEQLESPTIMIKQQPRVDKSPYRFLYEHPRQISEPKLEQKNPTSNLQKRVYFIVNILYILTCLGFWAYALIEATNFWEVFPKGHYTFQVVPSVQVAMFLLLCAPELTMRYLLPRETSNIIIHKRGKSSPFILEGRTWKGRVLSKFWMLKAVISYCVVTYDQVQGFGGAIACFIVIGLVLFISFCMSLYERLLSSKSTIVGLLDARDFHHKLIQLREEVLSFETTPLEDLISQGEGDQLEFKASFWTDSETGQKNRILQDAIVREVASFLNYRGGVLLIGIEDTEPHKAVGIDADLTHSSSVADKDGLEIHIGQVLMNGLEVVKPLWKISFPIFMNKMICRLDVEAAPKPIYARMKHTDEGQEKKEYSHFFRRIGSRVEEPSSTTMGKYIHQHWGN